ncbi:multidrug resistance protein 4 [Dendrothele bispora CBS 962.96]|uniref:Multidrug resistance protein 4 n=1 Tax=Dendrothele bispora (strain CBS 962.96) TaxID=1314807 RepID=A0A4S8L1K6_DENBC|nr:multidrug resistance protein 4 [Dendrothele bispora CBS 962.96]
MSDNDAHSELQAVVESTPVDQRKPQSTSKGGKEDKGSTHSSVTVQQVTESVIPVDKNEEAIANAQDDWENDPDNPWNWPARKKWTMVSIVSLYTFTPPLASSMLAPGLSKIAEQYGITSTTTTALVLSIFLLSFAIGPLVLAALSEIYGRTWILHAGALFSIAFSFGCAYAPNTGALLAFRFLAGFSGSAPIAIGGGSVSDLFSAKDRASAMAIYSLGPLIGPAVGPVAGGFIAESIGEKYVFVIIGALGAVSMVIGVPFLRETYAPIIRQRRALADGDPEKAKVLRGPMGNMSRSQYILANLIRPPMLLFGSLICFLLSSYMAFLYGIYYLMFATFPQIFNETYGFDVGIGGLVYLGLGIGFLLATWVGAKWADQTYHYLIKRNGGVGKPEMRIPALIFGSFFVPVGLFWYGWSAQAKVHWIMPIIGTGIFGFGLMTAYLPIQLYLVDTFTYAASAVAAASVFRSLFGFAFPLFADQMFAAMGVGGGNSFLAGMAIVLGVPFPIWLYFNGEKMRARSKLAR